MDVLPLQTDRQTDRHIFQMCKTEGVKAAKMRSKYSRLCWGILLPWHAWKTYTKSKEFDTPHHLRSKLFLQVDPMGPPIFYVREASILSISEYNIYRHLNSQDYLNQLFTI